MPVRAVFFDFGGVILRTEYQAPRQQLAERFRMDYDEIDRLVFNSESARRASLGEISEEEHWRNVTRRFNLPESEAQAFQDAFFGGTFSTSPSFNSSANCAGADSTRA